MTDALRSLTLLLALRDLGKSDGKALLKSAVKELIARRVLGADTIEEQRRMRSPKRRLVLVNGPEPIPSERVLRGAAQMIESAPSELIDGRVVRDLKVAAKHLARQPNVRKRAVDTALEELVDAGLVERKERKALGLVKVKVHVRTAAGDAALEADTSRRRRRDSQDDFDGELDSSFDSSFDSAFDSGFSSGDSGGGGGD